ncbi:hypothetical protein D3C85_802150 [compost metagenome]
MAAAKTPGTKASRYQATGASVILPTRNLAGKARAQRPGAQQDRGTAISNTLNRFVSNAISNISSRTDVNDIIRTLIREDGLFSSAANSMVALSTGAGYRIAGYDSAGVMSVAVASVAYSIIDRFSTLHDYSQGYNDKPGIQTLLATLQADVVCTGGCGQELVLDKAFGPERLVPVGYSTIEWYADGKGGRYPTQDGGEIELNIPTVFVAEHNRNPDEAYSVSLLRPGLSHTINFNGFLEDTHRAVNRTGHSRLIAKIDADKVRQAAPDRVKNDPALMSAFYETVRQQVEDALAGLEPEDAVISYDTVNYSVEDTGGNKSDYTGLLTTLGNLLGAALKTPASVSGLRAGGSQALSNAETLIYLQVVKATRAPVEEVMSRALTLACRLLGVEGHVYFEFLPINLRPDAELEAYYGTRQKRILELLSWGVINDAQACYELGLRPQGLQSMLAGTQFYTKSKASDATETDRSTSAGAALSPDTPAQTGGDDQ